jgi:hypothetical protein
MFSVKDLSKVQQNVTGRTYSLFDQLRHIIYYRCFFKNGIGKIGTVWFWGQTVLENKRKMGCLNETHILNYKYGNIME